MQYSQAVSATSTIRQRDVAQESSDEALVTLIATATKWRCRPLWPA